MLSVNRARQRLKAIPQGMGMHNPRRPAGKSQASEDKGQRPDVRRPKSYSLTNAKIIVATCLGTSDLLRVLPSLVDVFYHGFNARADVQFAVGAVDVFAYGFGADTEAIGDFLVAEALGQQGKGLALAAAEEGEF